MTGLLALWMGIASAADISVPAEHDPLAWARAWAEVVEALQDPALREASVRWEPDSNGRFSLVVEHQGQRARVSGLVPADAHAGRLEQLYVAVSLLGARPSTPTGLDDLVAPPAPVPARRAPPARREPPPAGPQAEAGALPPPDRPLSLLRPASSVAVPDAPIAVARDRGSLLLTALVLPGDGVLNMAGGALQGTWQPSWFGVGVRGVALYDRSVDPAQGELPVTGRVHEWRFEAVPLVMARAWSWRWFALTLGAGAGVSVRRLGVAGRTAGSGPVTVARGQLGFEMGGRSRVRIELSVTHDLRAVIIDFSRGASVRLPTTRPQLAVGATLGGRR